jgi:hypothetical protein
MVHYLRCTPIASMAHDIGISQCAFYRSFDPPHTSSIFRVPSTLTACVNASLPTSEMIDARWNTHVTPFVANRTESRCVTSATMNSTRDDAFTYCSPCQCHLSIMLSTQLCCTHPMGFRCQAPELAQAVRYPLLAQYSLDIASIDAPLVCVC